MKVSIDCGTHCLDAVPAGQAPRYRRHITRILLALVCLTSVTAVHAQEAGGFEAPVGYDSDMPWMPEVIATADAYVPDPQFNGGRILLDHFAASPSVDQIGMYSAQLSNGDIVVAGLVPDSPGTCANGAALCSIGLVRYTQTGQRVAWTSAGANGRSSNNYLVFPGAPFNRFQYIRDVKVRGNLIDVLVDEPDLTSAPGTPGRKDVTLVTFSEDGMLLGDRFVFGTSGGGQDTVDFEGSQILQVNASTLILSGTQLSTAGDPVVVVVNKLNIGGDGSLTQDPTWGSGYAGGANRYKQYYGNSCDLLGCPVLAGYVAKAEGLNYQAVEFYLTFNVKDPYFHNWDIYLLKISSYSGQQVFIRLLRFDDSNSSRDDYVGGLYVYQNDIYVAAKVARHCSDGIGLMKVDATTSALETGFGSAGKIILGGEGDTSVCAPPMGSYPAAMAGTSSRIGIAGYGRRNNGNWKEPMLAVIDSADGTILDFNTHTVERADGSRFGDAFLYGIYGGTSPTSPFTVSGNARDASSGNIFSYVTGRFVPVSADRIFSSGFGNGNDY